MKLEKKHSYKLSRMVWILFFSILLPVTAVAEAAVFMVEKKARDQIQEVEQTAFENNVRDYNASLDALQNSINLIITDSQNGYAVFSLDKEDTRFVMTRYSLFQKLDELRGMYEFVDGFYARLDGNKSVLIDMSASTAAEGDRQDYFREYVRKSDGFLAPQCIYYNEDAWYIRGFRYGPVEVGYLVSVDKVSDYLIVGHGEVYMDHTGTRFDEMDGNIFYANLRALQTTAALLVTDEELGSRNTLRWGMTITFTVLALILLTAVVFIYRQAFVKPIGDLVHEIEIVEGGNLQYRVTQYSAAEEFRKAEQALNRMLDSNHELEEEARRQAVLKEEQELINLKQQINPHLLLNSLNAIYSLAQNGKISEIQSFSLNLSRYFRYSLRNINEMVTLASELEFISNYTKVQRIRYPNRFYVMSDVDDEWMDVLIPPLVIQNLVENSIKYALLPDKEIEILVIVRKYGDRLRISVTDDGRGMSVAMREMLLKEDIPEDERGKHIGIWNCIRRLRYFYHEDLPFHIVSAPGEGTQVGFEIPVIRKDEDKDEDIDH